MVADRQPILVLSFGQDLSWAGKLGQAEQFFISLNESSCYVKILWLDDDNLVSSSSNNFDKFVGPNVFEKYPAKMSISDPLILTILFGQISEEKGPCWYIPHCFLTN